MHRVLARASMLSTRSTQPAVAYTHTLALPLRRRAPRKNREEALRQRRMRKADELFHAAVRPAKKPTSKAAAAASNKRA